MRVPKVPLDILVCTPDAESDVAQRCLKSLRDTTKQIECTITVEDNHKKIPFIHAKAINRALEKATGNLVICDDDIILPPGWLDAALDIAESQDDCGIIGFYLESLKGEAWGSAMWSGRDGTTTRCMDKLPQPCCIPSQCSACWFIVKTDRRFNEEYNKYRFEHVFAMETWEDGRKFWYVPVTIKHDCCTQFIRTVTDQKLRRQMCQADEEKYKREWIDTGREWDICEKITPYMPEAVVKSPEWNHERTIISTPATVEREERRAVVTLAVGDYYKTGIPLMQRYARRVNADFFCIDETWQQSETTPHFMKWHCNAILKMGYTRIAFIDADCLIMPNAPDIFGAVSPGTLGVYDEAPAMWQRRLHRQDTCARFVSSWRRQVGQIEYKYPGHYFNSGVMVFDATCNPFVERADGVYSFNTDTVFDQTYLNVVSAQYPKTLLDWRWNRMAITQASELIGSEDMFHGDPYILHYCGNQGQKEGIMEGVTKIMPEWKERQPGESQDGIYDFWRHVGYAENVVEVGSANGESAWIATDVIPEMKLTCVDPWKAMGDGRYGKQAETDFDTRHSWNASVTKMKATSKEAAKKIKNGTLDGVYIDAMHTDPWVTEDLTLWVPKVAAGGWIGGHDYSKELWPDVVNAVNKMFGGPDMVFQDTSWIVWVGDKAKRKRKPEPKPKAVRQDAQIPISTVNFVIGENQRGWILDRFVAEMKRYAPAGMAISTEQNASMIPGTLNVYIPYRKWQMYTGKTKSVVLFTHPDPDEAFKWKAAMKADAAIVMNEQYRQRLIDDGMDADRVYRINYGIDDMFRDCKLRIFNAGRVVATNEYMARKGWDDWKRLMELDWLHCVRSEGLLTQEQVKDEYLKADVIVSTATLEGGPMACLETLAMGRPYVGRKGVGLHDEYAQHITRYVDYDGLVNVLSDMYHAKENRAKAVADNQWMRCAMDVWRVIGTVAGRAMECSEPKQIEPEADDDEKPIEAAAAPRRRFGLHRG